jgi:hypothetical protein
MGASSGLMAASFGMQAANTLASSYSQSQALKAKGDYERTMSDINARNAELEAEDAVKRGESAAQEAAKKSKQLQGAQRAAAAASGIAIDSGSAGALRDEADLFGKLDQEAIKNNAWRQAFGLKSQANEFRNQGRLAQRTAKFEARTTMLTGGMNALSSGLQSAHYYGKHKQEQSKKK